MVLDHVVIKRDIELSKKERGHMNLTCIFRIHGECSFHGQNLCLGLMARLFKFTARYAPKLGGIKKVMVLKIDYLWKHVGCCKTLVSMLNVKAKGTLFLEN